MSYTNSCFSEHIASSIFNILGIQAQETILGTFEVGGKTKIICACKDFTTDGRRLFDFCSIKNTVLESGGSGTELFNIIDTIEKRQYASPKDLLEYFWDVFIVDALLGNFDRHNGNWGFLFDDGTGTAELVPVYDCGSCLLPQADEHIMQQVLTQDEALNARVFQFPNSAIKKDGKKLNYYDFLMSAENTGCNEALQRIVPRINMVKIKEFIEEVPYISDMQKQFYVKYIAARYEKILKPAWNMALSVY